MPTCLMGDLATSPVEPTCFTQAFKDLKWCQAMDTKMNDLLKKRTWSLVPYHSIMNLVGCKWVFKLKHKLDGSVDRYKARLIAKNFHQQLGLDYDETFSPIIKSTTVHTVCSLAIFKGWSIRQLDVLNAFLLYFLTETSYMEQPSGFINPARPNHVCKLHRSIYGLKQLHGPSFLALAVI